MSLPLHSRRRVRVFSTRNAPLTCEKSCERRSAGRISGLVRVGFLFLSTSSSPPLLGQQRIQPGASCTRLRASLHQLRRRRRHSSRAWSGRNRYSSVQAALATLFQIRLLDANRLLAVFLSSTSTSSLSHSFSTSASNQPTKPNPVRLHFHHGRRRHQRRRHREKAHKSQAGRQERVLL